MRAQWQAIVFVAAGLLVVGQAQDSSAYPKDRGQSLEARTLPYSSDVYYHIFVRSFRDSNGDRHGDLQGIIESLDYIKELGATGVLISPVFASRLAHNYFSSDFDRIDPEYGNRQDLIRLFREAHSRDMKVILDMEVQYLTDRHRWFRESFGNPNSQFGSFVYYNDELNLEPDSGFMGSTHNPSYTGEDIPIFTVNLTSEAVREALFRSFAQWVDPNEDGDPSDGLDGFRLDHIMDDLDDKGKLTNLLEGFWKPMFTGLREINPRLVFVGEQSYWGYGTSVLTEGDATAVFSFPTAFAYRELNRYKIADRVAEQLSLIPRGKTVFTFVENHDIARWAQLMNDDPAYLRMGAILNLFSIGTPIIYYGQELGATGEKGNWPNDGSDIPVREAHLWEANLESEGMATWYRDTGPWWDQSQIRSGRYRSVADQENDDHSLLQFYKKLGGLRQNYPSLASSTFQWVDSNSPSLIAFEKWAEDQRVLILLNPAHQSQLANIALAGTYIDLGANNPEIIEIAGQVHMPPKSYRILLAM